MFIQSFINHHHFVNKEQLSVKYRAANNNSFISQEAVGSNIALPHYTCKLYLGK